MAVDELNITGLAALNDDAPVTMVNLVKLSKAPKHGGDHGWPAYRQYSELVIKLIKDCGGTVLWAGNVEAVALGAENDGDWDYVVLVQYPSRRAFLDMMTSEAYAKANAFRIAGADNHVILAARQSYSKLASLSV